MADNPLTLEKMLRGSQNLDVWDAATNGDENTDWTNLVGDKGPSLKKIVKLLLSKAPIDASPFETKALMIADATLAEGSFAFVYGDIAEYNGVYVKKNGTWGMVSYDAQALSKIESILGIKHGVNIANLKKVHPNKYWNYQTGNLDDNTYEIYALGLYPVEPNTEYQVPTTYVDQTAFFDSNMKFIGGLAEVYSKGFKFTTPANAYYVGVSVKKPNIGSFMLAKSSEYPKSFVPYSITIHDLLVGVSQVIGLREKILETVGLYERNIINTSIQYIKNGYYVSYGDGKEYVVDWLSVVGAYRIKPNTEYMISNWQTDQIAFYDENMAFVGGIAQIDNANPVFTTPANASFIKISVKPSQVSQLVLTERQYFPSSYVPYSLGIKDLKQDTVKNNKIIVSANTADLTANFTGNNAVQNAIDSIVDASPTNRYTIIVKKGLYKITKASDFIGYKGYPAMVCPKDYVDIIGQGEDCTIIWAELPHDDNAIGASTDGNVYPRDKYQALYNYAGNSKISGITFVGKNLRYTNHQDDGRGANKSKEYDCVSFIFKGDKGYLKPMGTGTSTGEITIVKGGTSFSDSGDAFATHNNMNFEKPSEWHFDGHKFMSLGSNVAMDIQNDGSLLQDKINITGCSFGGKSYILNYIDVWLSGNNGLSSFNHAEWQVVGHSNEPFLFRNAIATGVCLKIQSSSTGNASTVRFDTNNDIYKLIVKNPNANSATLYNDYDEMPDGYIYRDGSVGLSGMAFGCVDLYDGAYMYDGGVNYTSIGKRLGNLTGQGKYLDILIDGVNNRVSFDKDYTAMTNQQIISEINSKLQNAVASLFVYGRQYYPILSDVSELAYNNTASYIPKGTVVTMVGGYIKPANNSEKVYGVALSDIPVVKNLADGSKKGSGLVLKRGYISANKSSEHFVLADNQAPIIGTRFAVSNGQLVTDSNGKISVDIDSGVVSINC